MSNDSDDSDSLEDIVFPTSTVIVTNTDAATKKSPLSMLKEWDDDAALRCFDLACQRATGVIQGEEEIWVPNKDVMVTSEGKSDCGDSMLIVDPEVNEKELRRKKNKCSEGERKQIPLFVAAIDPIYAAIELANRRKINNE